MQTAFQNTVIYVLFGLISIYACYRVFNFHKKNRPLIEFEDSTCSIRINNNWYKYNDIADIKVEEDVADFSQEDRYFMGDIGHGRLICDKIIFIMRDGVTQETAETYRRGQLHKILKHINKFKRLNFDVDKYRPATVTQAELYLIIITCIIFYVIFHI
ncbi:MAG: hypothetical protein ACI37R_06900 [Candidatus Avigastranaerophilus sp.]